MWRNEKGIDVDIGIDIEVDMDLDSDMAVSIKCSSGKLVAHSYGLLGLNNGLICGIGAS